MITGELKNKVDKLWEMFWTGGLTNPLDVMMKDLAVLQESPFSDVGSVSEVFDDLKMFMALRAVVEDINNNAIAA